MGREVTIEGPGKTFPVGSKDPLLLIAGPCVLEDEKGAFFIARRLKEICSRLNLNFVFKSSYDKANRTSHDSFRGPGLKKGLEILGRIREELVVPVTSDIHCVREVEKAAEVLDLLQIPAFLSRQTDLLQAAGRTGCPVNIKKGQFLAPWDMEHVADKVASTGNQQILLTERGVSFGYNNLVVDMRSLAIMRRAGWPVVFDATHSVQLPGGADGRSGGQREFVPDLLRAAVAVGVSALFMEVHPEPQKARCDGPNMIPLAEVEDLLASCVAINSITQKIDLEHEV